MIVGMALKFFAIVAKGLKLKVRKFWGLIPTFVEVTKEKLVGGLFETPPLLPILSRVNSTDLKLIRLSCINCINFIKVFNSYRKVFFYFSKSRRNAMRCSNHYDFLHLSFIFSFTRGLCRTQSNIYGKASITKIVSP